MVNDIETGKIYNEDCMETMERMAADQIDLVITSPPYNIGQNNCKDSQKYNEIADNIDNYFEWSKSIIDECVRVSRLTFWNVATMSKNKKDIYDLIGHYSEYIKDVVMWTKPNPPNPIEDGVLGNAYEYIIALSKKRGDKRKFYDVDLDKYALNHIETTVNSSNDYSDQHKATMPEKIPSYLISNFSIGGAVYDPFTGTGTTQLVAEKHGLEWIGSEINNQYCDIARKRIKRERDQLKAF